jgi:tRNA(Ile)-lysidine synthase
MPVLAAENPQVEPALARIAELAWEDERYWAPLVEASLESAGYCEDTSIILDLNAIARLEPALARRVLRAAAKRVRGGAEGLDLDHYEALYRLASARRDGMVKLAGLTAMRSFDQLRMARQEQKERQDVEVKIPGLGEFGGCGVAVRLTAWGRRSEEIRQSQEFSPVCRYNGGRHWLDGDRIAFPLVLRVWRAGDRYQPHGARREYSLHELFQRARVPRWERGCWPVIVSGERIVWSRRFGAADWAAAAPDSANVVEVREAGAGE